MSANNMNSDTMVMGIPEFYSGKNVLVTGATGFVGKALIEKLLRSCPSIGTVYIILRPKHNKPITQRLDDIINCPLFDRVKNEQPGVMKEKVVPLAGDMRELNLGLCRADQEILIENVHIIFHLAATVRFDEPLKDSVLLNVRGTREICHLALEVKKLQAFIHVSTAYVNCNRSETPEILYSAKDDWRKMIEIAEKLDEHSLAAMTDKIIDDMPNTYCFTKNLAEHVVHDMCHGKIPSKIFRPSIVSPSLREEPVYGWVDNFNGTCGLMIAGGKGVLHVLYSDPNVKLDHIPLDVVSKSLIVCAWDLVQNSTSHELGVIHCTSYNVEYLRHSIGYLLKTHCLDEIPMNDCLWKCNVQVTNNFTVFLITTIVFALIPSLLIDGLLLITGNKPRLLNIQKKLFIAQIAIHYFMKNEWSFPNDNLLKLQERIPVKDRDEWDYEFQDYDYNTYLKQCYLGARRYLLREPDDTLPKARKHYRLMCRIYVVWEIIYWALIALFVWKTASYLWVRSCFVR